MFYLCGACDVLQCGDLRSSNMPVRIAICLPERIDQRFDFREPSDGLASVRSVSGRSTSKCFYTSTIITLAIYPIDIGEGV